MYHLSEKKCKGSRRLKKHAEDQCLSDAFKTLFITWFISHIGDIVHIGCMAVILFELKKKRELIFPLDHINMQYRWEIATMLNCIRFLKNQYVSANMIHISQYLKLWDIIHKVIIIKLSLDKVLPFWGSHMFSQWNYLFLTLLN